MMKIPTANKIADMLNKLRQNVQVVDQLLLNKYSRHPHYYWRWDDESLWGYGLAFSEDEYPLARHDHEIVYKL